jgi:hypothetical protein
VLEAFGGAGYVEDTGLPVLLRDSQVLPIWEGTTNVLALDTLRAVGDGGDALVPLQTLVTSLFASVHDPVLRELADTATSALAHAESWLREAQATDRSNLEAGARRFALTLGRTLELALLIRHAQWSQVHEHDRRATAAARRFAHSGIDLIANHSLDDIRELTKE